MKFLWPEGLWAAALLAPLLVLLYLWLLHRRKKSTVRFASVALVKQALGKGPGGAVMCRPRCWGSRCWC